MTDLLGNLSNGDRGKAAAKSMPDWMDPMLAKLTHDHFSDEDWIYERKLDGERVIAYVHDNGKVSLLTRNRKKANDSYPEVQEALEKHAAAGCILDGEIVAFGSDNVSDFQRLQPRMHASSREESRASNVKVYYYVFDCLYADGHDITGCSLQGRKKVLKAAVDWNDPIRWTPYRKEKGMEYYEESCAKGWEGLIAKDTKAKYLHGRSGKWLKFKCVAQQEFVIGGYTEPKGSRVGLGALLLGFYRDGKLVYAGKVGTGFDDETLEDLHSRLTKLERKTSPYDEGEPERKEVHFVTPKLVCEVAFTEWTSGEGLRHPRYQGLRRDKKARDVHKEPEGQATGL